MRHHPRVVAMLLAVLISLANAACGQEISPEELALVERAEAARTAVIEKVSGTVVAIYGNVRQGGGSGVLFDQGGLALTNHHVVAGAGREGWAGLPDGKFYRWRLIGTDPGGDVAVIQLIGTKPLTVAPWGLSEKVRTGDWVLAMGNPFLLADDQTPTVTLGVVSGVARYQAGSGSNMLVYGDCLQIDTSINPGNSGGPSFNMRGEVIGINGRISAAERGRVNVGLGYAISMRQIRNFLPDLLATKVAQHGTLDAQFSNRSAGVICHAINLDSPAAQNGLKLGDRLLEFEGAPIRDANELAGRISTLPAHWPIHLVYEHDGQRRSLRVRLTSLAYELPPRPEPDTKPKPQEKPADPKDDPDRTEPNPKAKPNADPPQPVQPAGLQLDKQGEIQSAEINAQNARRIVERWRSDTAGGPQHAGIKAVELREDLVAAGGRKIASVATVIALDGRFQVATTTAKATQTLTYDGQAFTARAGENQPPEQLAPLAALARPRALEALAMALMLSHKPLSGGHTVVLEGADKAGGQRACRLRLGIPRGGEFRLWLSLFDDDGRPSVRLLKSGLEIDGSSLRPATLYRDWRVVSGVAIPHRRTIVHGLSEEVVHELHLRQCKALKTTPEGFPAFAAPGRP